MPVQRGFDFEVILDGYFNVVTLIYFNQWTRLLTVDEIYLSLESIYAAS